MGDEEITNQYREILDRNLRSYGKSLEHQNTSKKDSYTTVIKTGASTAAGATIGALIAGPPGAFFGAFFGFLGSSIHSEKTSTRVSRTIDEITILSLFYHCRRSSLLKLLRNSANNHTFRRVHCQSVYTIYFILLIEFEKI